MRRERELAAVTFGHFTNDLYAAFLTPLLPMLVAKFDMSLAMAGLLAAAHPATSSIVQPLVGHLADTSGSRVFIVLGPVITAISMCLIGLADSRVLLVVLLIAAGIGSGMFHPQGAAMAGSIDEKRKGFMLSVFTTAGELGYAMGPLVVLSVVTSLGVSYTYVTGILGVVVALLIYKFAPRAPSRRLSTKVSEVSEAPDASAVPLDVERLECNRIEDGGPSDDGLAITSRRAEEVHGKQVPARAIAVLWVIAAVRLAVSSSFTTFLPIYLREMGLPLLACGSVASMFMFAGTIGIMAAGPVADRVGSFKLMTAALIGSVPLLLGFLHVHNVFSYLFLAAGAVTLYAPTPVITMIAQNLAPARAGTVSAFMMGVAWGAGSIGATGVGVLADLLGIRAALTLLLGALVVAAVLTRVLERQTQPRHAPLVSTAHEPTCR